jgi:hypothetical protein
MCHSREGGLPAGRQGIQSLGHSKNEHRPDWRFFVCKNSFFAPIFSAYQNTKLVILTKSLHWIPACAGMTIFYLYDQKLLAKN